MRANPPPTDGDAACQLELFDGTLAESGRGRNDLPVASDGPPPSNASLEAEALPIESAERSENAGGGRHAGADRATLAALEAALVDARSAADDRPALMVLASRLSELGTPPVRPPAGGVSLRQARDDWLRRLEAQQKSESAVVAYRVAIDDLLEWSEANGRNVLEEATIVDYLRSYQQRAGPAQATYYRRFLLLRKFLRWVSQREDARDPFVDLEPPPKPRQERDWLTPEEFRLLLNAAGRPERNLPGLAERDRLALLASSQPGYAAPSSARSNGVTSSSTDGGSLCSSVTARAARRGASLCQRASPASCGSCATPASPSRPTPSSAGLPADACRRRSSPTSSVARRTALGSRSTSPRTRCATPRRPGSGKNAATPASLPSTSATPTSRRSRATRTSTARSSSTRRAGWSSSPLLRKNPRRRLKSSRAVTLSRISLLRPKTAPTTHGPCRSSRVVVVGVAGGADATERVYRDARRKERARLASIVAS
jgi:hypothetical protein